MWLRNVNILGQKGAKDILVRAGFIHEVSERVERVERVDEGEMAIEVDRAIAFPGLINSHDHLEFNLFPPIKNHIYNNYTEWGNDIQMHNRVEIDKVMRVPLQLRIQWGIYKNLLNGFTTVVNHGKHLKITDNILNVVQQIHSIHSVGFEKKWKWELNNPARIRLPVNVHVGEGKDGGSYSEINKLIRYNFLSRRIVGVHGVAMDQEQAVHFDALVWCPASNYFMLNKTAAIDRLKERTNILFGSDSTLTSSWNIWEHIRLAREENLLTDTELIESLTTKPALVWELPVAGKLERNYRADLVVARKNDNPGSFDNFFSTNPEDILLVIHGGRIRLFDSTLRKQIRGHFDRFCKIVISGSEKYVYGDLNLLINKVKKHYPEAGMPFTNLP